METLFYLEIPTFYHAYAREVYSGAAGTHKGRLGPAYVIDERYYCLNCGTNFKVEHRPVPMSYRFNDAVVSCPVCGQWLYNLGHRQEIAVLSAHDEQDSAPIRMTLRLKETKDAVTLHVQARVVHMDADRRTYIYNKQERIQFDIRHRQTVFTYTVRDHGLHTHQVHTKIGKLLDDDLFTHSLLRHINSRNLVFKTHLYHTEPIFEAQDKQRRTDIYLLLKTLREAVQRKWKAIYGYPLKSLFVPSGSHQGLLLFPLFNIAWRLQYPDANNLPRTFSGASYMAQSYLKAMFFTEDLVQAYWQNPYTKKRISSVQAVIRQLGLPDIPFVRQQLSRDLLAGPVLQQVFSIVKSPDYARQLLACLGWKNEPKDAGTPAARYIAAWELDTIRKALRYWPAEAVFPVLRKKTVPLYELRDTVSMMAQMPDDALKQAKRIPIRKAHDWLINKIQEIKEAGFPLRVPDAIRRRLTMQLDNGYLQFFLPRHSHDLDSASKIFHNCVRTYSARVASRDCQIVLMTDDNGLMRACLEVRDNALVQAKLKFNKPVSEDAAINSAIRDWCRMTGLAIKTADVRQIQYLVPIERRAV
ncbi:MULTISPECIES: PcfJ domain-containing protein [unclassified Megasphaera]|uniref:PcfJ domain-containing protein n=1 Tax=unclassified Megasphaera TaxID=2626256 RepID=UPI0025C5839D|nr:PcfJ domain-containing protein [Megasphaera sp. UBA4233]